MKASHAAGVGAIAPRLEPGKPRLLEAPAHPSRELPQCSRCVHFKDTHSGHCNHPTLEVSVIDGSPLTTATQARMGACGPSGKLFALMPDRPGRP